MTPSARPASSCVEAPDSPRGSDVRPRQPRRGQSPLKMPAREDHAENSDFPFENGNAFANRTLYYASPPQATKQKISLAVPQTPERTQSGDAEHTFSPTRTLDLFPYKQQKNMRSPRRAGSSYGRVESPSSHSSRKLFTTKERAKEMKRAHSVDMESRNPMKMDRWSSEITSSTPVATPRRGNRTKTATMTLAPPLLGNEDDFGHPVVVYSNESSQRAEKDTRWGSSHDSIVPPISPFRTQEGNNSGRQKRRSSLTMVCPALDPQPSKKSNVVGMGASRMKGMASGSSHRSRQRASCQEPASVFKDQPHCVEPSLPSPGDKLLTNLYEYMDANPSPSSNVSSSSTGGQQRQKRRSLLSMVCPALDPQPSNMEKAPSVGTNENSHSPTRRSRRRASCHGSFTAAPSTHEDEPHFMDSPPPQPPVEKPLMDLFEYLDTSLESNWPPADELENVNVALRCMKVLNKLQSKKEARKKTRNSTPSASRLQKLEKTSSKTVCVGEGGKELYPGRLEHALKSLEEALPVSDEDLATAKKLHGLARQTLERHQSKRSVISNGTKSTISSFGQDYSIPWWSKVSG